MKRATKILGTATVIGLLAVPVAQSYDDWITPLLWNWVTNSAYPMLNEHEVEITALQQENSEQQIQIDSQSMTAGWHGRYVGFSTSQVTGAAGLTGYNAACQSDYGPSSRIAFSDEILESTASSQQSGSAWVLPKIIAAGSGTSYGAATDASGNVSTELFCQSASNGHAGLIATDTLTITQDFCSSAIRVACSIVESGPKTQYRYVGFSTSQVTGAAGLTGYNAACQSDYGPSSRIAYSDEILESTASSQQSGNAWVLPKIIAAGSGTSYGAATDASGNVSTELFCQSASNGHAGLIATETLTITQDYCGNTIRVACSLPAE